MQSYSTVRYRVIKCLALFAIGAVGCQPPHVPGEGCEFPKEYTETVTSRSGEEISFEMVLIPGGDFEMGDHNDGLPDAPVHTVYLDLFYMSPYEITTR